MENIEKRNWGKLCEISDNIREISDRFNHPKFKGLAKTHKAAKTTEQLFIHIEELLNISCPESSLNANCLYCPIRKNTNLCVGAEVRYSSTNELPPINFLRVLNKHVSSTSSVLNKATCARISMAACHIGLRVKGIENT